MAWEISGKVILVTGGAGGIGLCSAKELLRRGAKGVTLADINTDLGKQAVKDLEVEFGEGRSIFLKTDVTDAVQFRDAFETTLKNFKSIDVLINCAGIVNEILWEKTVAINLNGTINGMLLGLHEYLPKYKQGGTGVILNVCSILGLQEASQTPVYTATKFAIHGLTRAWGAQVHFEKTGIRVIGICPGVTTTELLKYAMEEEIVFNEHYRDIMLKMAPSYSVQTPEKCAEALCEILTTAKSGTLWVAEGGNRPYEYVLPDREIFNPNKV